MTESALRVYDGMIDAPAGMDSPGPIIYSSTWSVDENKKQSSKQYSIPKQKRVLKFNSANGVGVGPAKYSPNGAGPIKANGIFSKAERKFAFPAK